MDDDEAARLKAKLQELLDKQAVSEILVAYCDCLDKMDLASLARLFCEDCSVDYGPEPHLHSEGSAALERDLARMWRFVRTSHHLSNVKVTFDSSDAACATSYVFAWHEYPDGTVATMMGQYHDRLVRLNDGWRIRSRRLLLNGNDEGFTSNINRFERLPSPDAPGASRS